MRALLAAVLTVSGCAVQAAPSDPVVVASTPIIADMVSHVGGDHLRVQSLVPPGADPHTFEPTMTTLKQVARSDLAFTNGLLLEDARLTQALEATMDPAAPIIDLGEAAVEFGAYHIPLVENAGLATAWLGFRVGADNDITTFTSTDVRGPGTLISFTTGTFGQVSAWLGGPQSDASLSLPASSHTHMSWAFTAPGIYELDLASGTASTTVTFAVGVEAPADKRVINHGHLDITSDGGAITLRGDDPSGTSYDIDPTTAAIAIPHSAASTVPNDPAWRFMCKPGADVWILAQAVIGKHVHGEIDPHLWLDVDNAIAYVDVIEKKLAESFPDHAEEFKENAETYRAELARLDTWMTQVLATIPERQRKLVTSHDAYGYLAKGYGLEVTGFAAPNPSLEPSARDLTILSDTLVDQQVGAVFIEKTQVGQSSHLESLSRAHNITLCALNADVPVTNYIDLMVENTHELKSCLDPDSLPAWDF